MNRTNTRIRLEVDPISYITGSFCDLLRDHDERLNHYSLSLSEHTQKFSPNLKPKDTVYIHLNRWSGTIYLFHGDPKLD